MYATERTLSTGIRGGMHFGLLLLSPCAGADAGVASISGKCLFLLSVGGCLPFIFIFGPFWMLSLTEGVLSYAGAFGPIWSSPYC